MNKAEEDLKSDVSDVENDESPVLDQGEDPNSNNSPESASNTQPQNNAKKPTKTPEQNKKENAKKTPDPKANAKANKETQTSQNSPSNKINPEEKTPQKNTDSNRAVKLIKQRLLEKKEGEKDQEPKLKSDVVEAGKDLDDDTEVEKIPDHIIKFVDEFKRNSVRILRFTGIYQKFRSVLHGFAYNIGKMDEFLEYGGGLMNISTDLIASKVNSEVKFNEASIEYMDDIADKILIIE